MKHSNQNMQDEMSMSLNYGSREARYETGWKLYRMSCFVSYIQSDDSHAFYSESLKRFRIHYCSVSQN